MFDLNNIIQIFFFGKFILIEKKQHLFDPNAKGTVL